MKGSIWRGVVYCCLWYLSILCGFLSLCCPILPLLFIHNQIYRHAVDIIFAIWELYPVALMEILFDTEFVIYGDDILPWEKSILIMNHRTRLDWNFLWAAMHYGTVTPAHRLKFVLKAPIRHAPGPGWVMQMAGFFFIHRRWEYDKSLLSDMLDYFQELNHTFQVLIFPEGTDLTKKSIIKSNKYADENNLEHYQQVLHPKTTGFSFLVEKMKSGGQLDSVYDLSVGYPGTLPETEFDVIKGIFPEKVHFEIRRYSVNELPTSEEELRDWLCHKWKHKEETLTKFYSNGKFLTPKRVNAWPRPLSNSLQLSVLFWTTVIVITFYLLLVSTFFQIYSLFNCALFIIMSFICEGMFHAEIAWYHLKYRNYIKNNKTA